MTTPRRRSWPFKTPAVAAMDALRDRGQISRWEHVKGEGFTDTFRLHSGEQSAEVTFDIFDALTYPKNVARELESAVQKLQVAP